MLTRHPERRVALLVTGCALAFGGCTEPTGADAAAAAVAFAQAEPTGACRLLAPETAAAMATDGDCVTALAALDLPRDAVVQAVEVAGEAAKVRLPGQVLFLARFPDGWRVTAAGCVRPDPDPAVPHDCEVER